MRFRLGGVWLGCIAALGCEPDDGPREHVGLRRVEPRPLGRFTAVPGALGDVVGPRNVALGDCNGDGWLDVVTFQAQGPTELYVGVPGPAPRFERAPGALLAPSARVAVFVDLDGDRHDDLVLVDAAVTMLPGEGGCRFGAPVTLAGPGDSYARQVLVTDANRDGRADLSITQLGSPTTPHRLLVARGDGTFDEVDPRPTPLYSDLHRAPYLGFGMFYEDMDGDGAMDLFALIDQGLGWFSWGRGPGELGQSIDDGASVLVASADVMALAPIDYDRDGVVEWFASGIGDRSRLLRSDGARRLVDEAGQAGVTGERADIAWGSHSLDVDLDGWTDLVVLREGSEAPEGGAPPGPVTVFMNRHDGTFAEMGRQLIGLELNAKGLSCGPLSSAGPVGCFAMNPDGPLLLVDGVKPQGLQAVVVLRGTVSAPDASGARVSVDGVSPPMVFAVGGQCSYSAEHARRLEVPLLERGTAAVTVTWPSGIVQRGVTVLAGHTTEMIEPAAVTLSRRVAPADGESTVEVAVDPRAADARAADVALDGAGRWDGEATVDARGVVRRVLRAPSAPGEARLVVSLDGVPLRVRPRVVFE